MKTEQALNLGDGLFGRIELEMRPFLLAREHIDMCPASRIEFNPESDLAIGAHHSHRDTFGRLGPERDRCTGVGQSSTAPVHRVPGCSTRH